MSLIPIPVISLGYLLAHHCARGLRGRFYAFPYQLLLLAVLVTSNLKSHAEGITQLKGAAPQFPKIGEQYEKAYQDLLFAVGESLIKVDTYLSATPVSRAIRDIEIGNLDFYFPVMCSLNLPATSPVRMGTESLGYLPMALYSKRSKPIVKADLESATYQINHSSLKRLKGYFEESDFRKINSTEASFENSQALFEAISKDINRELNDEEKYHVALATFEYAIESMRIQKSILTFPVQSSISISNGFKKFSRDRVDAFIVPPIQLEAFIADAGIENEVFRSVFDIHSLCYLVSNSERGDEVDKLLKQGFKTVKQNGTYDRLFGKNDIEERQWVEKYKAALPNQPVD